jgi:hypothetical protein
MQSQSHKEPHHFGGARAKAITRCSSSSGSSYNGSCFKADVQHREIVKNVTKCNNSMLFLFISTKFAFTDN